MKIFDAIEDHDVHRLAALLAGGEDPNAPMPDCSAWVPLKQAIEELPANGSVEAVALLIRWGADVDGGRVPGNATPLIVAVMYDQFDAAMLLLAAGADPNTRDEEGDTPLSLSLRSHDRRLDALLRLFGAKDVP